MTDAEVKDLKEENERLRKAVQWMLDAGDKLRYTAPELVNGTYIGAVMYATAKEALKKGA